MLNLDQNWETFAVDPARLTHGTYRHDSEQEIDDGDIVGSYSADRITESDSIRKPFTWKSCSWVCVAIQGRSDGGQTVKAYRLSPATSFTGEPTTYGRKVAIEDGDHARNDPQGFYHGMTVKLAGESMVLTGPPALFVADEAQRAAEQLTLFS